MRLEQLQLRQERLHVVGLARRRPSRLDVGRVARQHPRLDAMLRARPRRVGVQTDEQVGLGRVRPPHPLAQRQVLVARPRHHDVEAARLQIDRQPPRHRQRHPLLGRPDRPRRRARVRPTVSRHRSRL
jgi:hypothetical protein